MNETGPTATCWLQPSSFMRPCTLEDTLIGTPVYNIFAARQQKVDTKVISIHVKQIPKAQQNF